MSRRHTKRSVDKKDVNHEGFFPNNGQAKHSFFSPAVHASGLVQQATETSGEPVQDALKQPLSEFLGKNIDQVRIHTNSASQQAADSVQARAFTIGNQVHLGADVMSLSVTEKNNLLAHEIIHTVQQGSNTPQLQGSVPLSQPRDAVEQQACAVADSFSHAQSHSAALGMRNNKHIDISNSPAIHRDIKGSKNLLFGKMEVDFTSDTYLSSAKERGEVIFHPNDAAPESEEIRMVQIVRMIDTAGSTTTAGDQWEFKGSEEDRNKVRTTADVPKNVAGGFFVDHFAGSVDPRTKATDNAVSPYFGEYGDDKTGQKKGDTKTPASLWDAPNADKPVKYNFVTSAKAVDTGVWYGTALWGFEIVHDEAGIAMIKNEYKRFRNDRGATTDAALEAFNNFYKNPGTTDAPAD